MNTVTERSKFTYKCANCNFENYSSITPTGLSKTKLGNYGDNATPQPELFAEEMLSSTTISFSNSSVGGRITEAGVARTLENDGARDLEDLSGSASEGYTILDSLRQFKDARFQDAMLIRIESDSGTNDGDYKIASRGVQRGEILLESSLTTETASAAGNVKIYRLLYKPNVTEGCPFCGTLNSRRAYGFQSSR